MGQRPIYITIIKLRDYKKRGFIIDIWKQLLYNDNTINYRKEADNMKKYNVLRGLVFRGVILSALL